MALIASPRGNNTIAPGEGLTLYCGISQPDEGLIMFCGIVEPDEAACVAIRLNCCGMKPQSIYLTLMTEDAPQRDASRSTGRPTLTRRPCRSAASRSQRGGTV